MLCARLAPGSAGRASSSSVVRSSERWLNAVAAVRPGGTDGATTSAGTCCPALSSSLSHVMKTAVRPDRYCGEARILGTKPASHLSPCSTSCAASEAHDYECMSWQRLGVTNVNRAERSGVAPSGTSRRRQEARRRV